MSIKSKAPAEAGTPTCVTRFDGARVPATDYHPVWLDSLADDVTIEGSAMNGVVQGAEAVRSVVTYIRTLYDDQELNFADTPTASTSPPASPNERSWRYAVPR